MKKTLLWLTISLIALFSLAVSIQVWKQFSPDPTEQAYLTALAFGIEMSKIILISSAYGLYRRRNDLYLPVTVFAVITTLTSITIMVTYFDSRLAYYTLNSQSVAESNQLKARVADAKIKAAEGLQRYDRHTNSIKALDSIDLEATPVTTRSSPMLQSLSREPVKRYFVLSFIAATIDFTIAILLLIAASEPRKIAVKYRTSNSSPAQSSSSDMEERTITNVYNDLTAPPPKETPATDSVQVIIGAIQMIPPGEIVGVNKLAKEYGVSSRVVSKAMEPFIKNQAVIKNENNRFVRTERALIQSVK